MTRLRLLIVPAAFLFAAAMPASIFLMNWALALWLGTWVLAGTPDERRRFADALLPLAPWMAASVLAWAAAGPLPAKNLRFLFAWLAYPLAATYLPAVDRRRWLLVFFAVLAATVLVGFVQHANGNKWIAWGACDFGLQNYTGGVKQFWCGFKGGTRARGFFYTPMTYAAVVLYGVLVAAWWVAREKSRLVAAGLVLFAMGLAMTSSRNAWVGLAAGLPFILGAQKKAWLAAAAVAAAMGLVVLASPAVRSRLATFEHAPSADPATSTGARMFLWRDAVAQFEERPVLGWGPGTFSSNVAARHPDVKLLSNKHAHNSYLQALAETGLVGFAAMLASWLWLAVRAVRRGGAGRLGLAVLAGFAGAGLFEANYLDSEVVINFLVWMAFAATYPKPSESPS
jgi:O-antigen ligase